MTLQYMKQEEVPPGHACEHDCVFGTTAGNTFYTACLESRIAPLSVQVQESGPKKSLQVEF